MPRGGLSVTEAGLDPQAVHSECEISDCPVKKKKCSAAGESLLGLMAAASYSFFCCLPVLPVRENILVLDIFFEALNYETIEQKKAYEVAALLGK